MNRLTIATLLLAGSAVVWPLLAARSAKEKKAGWPEMEYLVGDWVGEGSSDVGKGSGEFSFQWDLQNRVLVRKNVAIYPATEGRPVYRHDDLMIFYKESEGGPLQAVFFDNEGHVIRYVVTVFPERGAIQCLSEAMPSTPRYRFTYWKTGADSLAITFEITPPGKPDSFTKFIEARAKRK